VTGRGAAAGSGPRAEAGRASGFLVGLLALLALVFVLARFASRRQAGEPPPAAAFATEGAALPPLVEDEPTAPPGGAANPAPGRAPRAGSAEYVVPWRTGVPATPTPWEPLPTPTRWPTPAPRPCVEYSFEWGDSPAVIGQILVEVRVRNRCGRKLEALEVMFRAEGIRGGDTIYSGQGNLLEPIYPDSVRTVMIALPGASTFYDSVTVMPVLPPVR
jgi:hypothetical protein